MAGISLDTRGTKADTMFKGLSALLVAFFSTIRASASFLYVDVNSTNPVPPFASWDTAATNIQDAVDAASTSGAVVLVSNGVYRTGGRVVYGTVTNRVAVTNPIVVMSFGGPNVTTIEGYQVPGTTNGGAAVRCAFLTNGAVLAGFTISNGATARIIGFPPLDNCAGGVFCASTHEVVSNCLLTANAAAVMGGGGYGGTFNKCVFANNLVVHYNGQSGGGASFAILNDCTLLTNFANYGGGASDSTLSNCVLSGNSASPSGGGVNNCDLINCTLTFNSVTPVGAFGATGGGAYKSTLNNCLVSHNKSDDEGGGARLGVLNNCTVVGNTAAAGGGAAVTTLNNCVVFGNSAQQVGGGAFYGTLNNCTVVQNSAPNSGGVDGGVMNNSIVYYNFALDSTSNYSGGGQISYCCTAPLPIGSTNFVANISDEPLLTDFAHISAQSPCRGAGNPAFSVGLDIDGETWANPPSIGCDEYHQGAILGPLDVSVQASYSNAATGFRVDFTGAVNGHASANYWDFGDGTILSNRLSTPHIWAIAGDFPVVLRAYNDSFPGGVSATSLVHVLEQPIQYVAFGNTNPVPPYLSWTTAATNIQDAIDLAFVNGTILVSNGVYAYGGRTVYGAITNRVTLTSPVTLRSARSKVRS